VSAEEARAVIPRLATLYDEPFADSSQIPTFLVSQLASHHVKVALSGDGGDVLFGGYNRYIWADRVWRWMARIPPRQRRLLAAVVERARPAEAHRRAARVAVWLPRPFRQRLAGEKLQKLAGALRASDQDALFLQLLSTWSDPGALTAVTEPMPRVLDRDRPPLAGFTGRMMCTDALLYLPDDILVKVDRATMGVSLEGRVPILDVEVAIFAASLPPSLRVRGTRGKWALRALLARYVPSALFDRPKMGFSVPLGPWLRGPLRAWAESELDVTRLRDAGLDPGPIRTTWREHLEGRRDHHARLWAILMFQGWHAAWGERRAPA
jgi:asparagine synthase (glutamine-hydrolysing)